MDSVEFMDWFSSLSRCFLGHTRSLGGIWEALRQAHLAYITDTPRTSPSTRIIERGGCLIGFSFCHKQIDSERLRYPGGLDVSLRIALLFLLSLLCLLTLT